MSGRDIVVECRGHDAAKICNVYHSHETKHTVKQLNILHCNCREPGAEQKFKEISNAYEVLSDDEKRSIYEKLGMKYCYNRPCVLYAVKAPSFKSEDSLTRISAEDLLIVNLTLGISSAFFPWFSPDGKYLIFLSAKSSVDSRAHSATDSLYKIDWPSDGKARTPSENCRCGVLCSVMTSLHLSRVFVF